MKFNYSDVKDNLLKDYFDLTVTIENVPVVAGFMHTCTIDCRSIENEYFNDDDIIIVSESLINMPSLDEISNYSIERFLNEYRLNERMYYNSYLISLNVRLQ